MQNITCVILEEGGECKFIHKSIQEFHAACFVESQPDEAAELFYANVATKWNFWDEELQFLSKIDEYRFQKCFLIPDLEKCLGHLAKDTRIAAHADLPHLFGEFNVEFGMEFEPRFCGDFHRQWSWQQTNKGLPDLITAIRRDVRTFEEDFGRIAATIAIDDEHIVEFIEVRMKDLLNSELGTSFSNTLRLVRDTQDVLNRARASVSNVENRRHIFDLA